MTVSLGHSNPPPKNELSSRPKRSEVEGPAVDSSSTKCEWKRRPPLCHPERSRLICSSADHSWKCVFDSATGSFVVFFPGNHTPRSLSDHSNCETALERTENALPKSGRSRITGSGHFNVVPVVDGYFSSATLRATNNGWPFTGFFKTRPTTRRGIAELPLRSLSPVRPPRYTVSGVV